MIYQGRLRTPEGERTVEVRADAGALVEIRPWRGEAKSTTFATAGFVDAHCHPAGLGRSLAELDLTGVATYAGALERIAAAPGEGWLSGRG